MICAPICQLANAALCRGKLRTHLSYKQAYADTLCAVQQSTSCHLPTWSPAHNGRPSVGRAPGNHRRRYPPGLWDRGQGISTTNRSTDHPAASPTLQVAQQDGAPLRGSRTVLLASRGSGHNTSTVTRVGSRVTAGARAGPASVPAAAAWHRTATLQPPQLAKTNTSQGSSAVHLALSSTTQTVRLHRPSRTSIALLSASATSSSPSLSPRPSCEVVPQIALPL